VNKRISRSQAQALTQEMDRLVDQSEKAIDTLKEEL
jgi:hypothetical protein